MPSTVSNFIKYDPFCDECPHPEVIPILSPRGFIDIACMSLSDFFFQLGIILTKLFCNHLTNVRNFPLTYSNSTK